MLGFFQKKGTIMKEFWSHWYNKYGAIATGFAIGVAGYQTICWEKLSASDWGTWIGSIGTVGTLIGAIWLGTLESRRRRAEDTTKAFLALAIIKHKIIDAGIIIKIAVEGINNLDREHTETFGREPILGLLKNLDMWTLDDLIHLWILNGNLGEKLAETIGNIRYLVDAFESGAFKYICGSQKTFDTCKRTANDALETAESTRFEMARNLQSKGNKKQLTETSTKI
jgi:hypothetical protein